MLGILRDGIRPLSAAASEGRNLPLQTRMLLRLQASRTAERCCRHMNRIFVAAAQSGRTSDARYCRLLAVTPTTRQHASNPFQTLGMSIGRRLEQDRMYSGKKVENK